MKVDIQAFDGGCTCGHVRYRMTSEPLIVHGCHCRLCQRQSGSAFAVNALIEKDRVEVTSGEFAEITVSTPSGAGQRIARCPKCQIALWSNNLVMEGGLGELVNYVRVGTLENPDPFPPDVHIFTATKQPWVILPQDASVVPEFYDVQSEYSPESYARRAALLELAAGRFS